MSLSSIGDGGVHNRGAGYFANVGFTTGLILPYLDIVFVGLFILLRVRINYYASYRPLTLPYVLLRVWIVYYACYRSPTAPLY